LFSSFEIIKQNGIITNKNNTSIIVHILKIVFPNIFLKKSSINHITLYMKIMAKIAHNVPDVYDGLAARIRKCAAFAGPTKCGGEKPH
jgi:hypothetical protein